MIQLAGLHEAVRPYAEYAVWIAHQFGIKPVITSVKRSWAEQTKLRANYEHCLATGQYKKTKACMWPANKPGDSSHQWGLAFDSWVPDDQMAKWVLIRRYVGFEVPEYDVIHAGVPNWRQYRPYLESQGLTGR